MSLTKDEIVETFYTAGLTTLGAVGIGYASKETYKGRTRNSNNNNPNRKTGGCSRRRLTARTIPEEEGLPAGQPVQDPVDLGKK